MEIEMPVLQTYTSPLRGIWKITETFPELPNLFSSDKKESRAYIINMKSEARKTEYLAVRLLLNHLLEKNVEILHHTDGSPYLIDNEYYISISHTKGYAAIILSKAAYPGIDIEYRSERAFLLKERFLGEEELNLISREKTISPADMATLFWCAKETAFKSLKYRDVDFVKHLHVLSCLMDENAGTLVMEETKTEKKQSFAIDFEITDDYIITWKG
ncbi:MAG: 4'-phosphopantetheinyl transferase superfamily protein [Tannerella sp.]|jgi:4'-phosphopantetheinyl transferase EntD|nr:4'-phosphopantetheinyl transferase superfamily protein [Tannerella sp.]